MCKRTLSLALVLLALASSARAQITIPNTFVNGNVIDATAVNANFTAVANNALNRTGGTMTGSLTGVSLTLSTPLNIASGGTNGSATPTNGGVMYGTGTAYAVSAAGSSNQVLQSVGAGTPTWTSTPTIGVGNVTGNLAYARLPTGSGTWTVGGTVSVSTNASGFALKVLQIAGLDSTYSGLFVETSSTAVKTLDIRNSGSDIFVVTGDGNASLTGTATLGGLASSVLAAPSGHQYFLCIGSTGAVVSQASACSG